MYSHLDSDKHTAPVNQLDEAKKRGKLKIFFGMCPGVGKTYSMLQTAHQDFVRGVDIVVGWMEPDNYHDTEALLGGLEIIPQRTTSDGKGEMDLDAIIARHPYLVVVDELAHTNATGSRHTKRYQDVQELLDNGINVYTTLNIQNLESRSDIVARVTGVEVTETVPDSVLAISDDLEFVDITSSAFLDRISQGKVRIRPQAGMPKNYPFFSRGNIIALREIALRFVADRVGKQYKAYVQVKRIGDHVKAGAHLLVLMDETPSSAQVLRRAKNLSYSMEADMIALYVESGRALDEEQREQLTRNIDLAREFGAGIIITSGKDAASTALDIAGKENITHIIVEKPRRRTPLPCPAIFRRDIVSRLSRKSNGVDIYVVNPGDGKEQGKKRAAGYNDNVSLPKQYLIVLVSIPLIVLLCLPIAWATDYHVSFIMYFGVLALAWMFRLNIGPIALASGLIAYTWGCFFVPPYSTMKGIINPNDVVAIFVFFGISLATGAIVSRVSSNERQTKRREEKTNALFRLTDRLASADRYKEIISAAKEESLKYFGVELYFLLQDGFGTIPREQKNRMPGDFTEEDFTMAQWTFKHSKISGKYADTFSTGQYTFYPLTGIYINPGVAVVKHKKKLDSETELFGTTFLRQMSNALERHYYSLRARNADLLFESDKLYRSLFNSVSHEFRIPIATIMGAADTLLADEYSEEIRKELYTGIFTASTRLSRLTDNLLNMSRLENNKIAARTDWVDLNDLFNEVVDSLEEDLKPFEMEISVPPSMPLVKLDFGLMQQALYNLVDNSCKYAPQGSKIELKAFYDDGYVIIQEMNRGGGFIPEDLPIVFNKFYRAENKMGGGLGLGLSIVKGFIEAHGGTISVENRRTGGVRFIIKIPTEVSYTDNFNTLT